MGACSVASTVDKSVELLASMTVEWKVVLWVEHLVVPRVGDWVDPKDIQMVDLLVEKRVE